MSMNSCSKCLENMWEFENIDGYVTATCKFCSNEVEFKAKKKKVAVPGGTCRYCDSPLQTRESKFRKKKLEKKYYYTHYLRCNKCKKDYWIEEYKIYNK